MAVAADYLTCGLCQTEFPLAHIVAFIQHKKYDCDAAATSDGLLLEVEKLHKYACVSCPEKFAAAVTLLQHLQLRHQIKLFMEEVYSSRAETAFSCSPRAISPAGKSMPPHGNVEPVPASATSTSYASSTPGAASVVGTPARKTECDLAASAADTPLNRCCASVVPKKRKRHIELKHSYVGTSSGTAASKARRRSLSSLASAQHRANTDDDDGDTIYIDVNPSGGMPSEHEKSPTAGQQQNKSAVILQPGNTYAISSSSALPYVGITYGNRQAASAGYAVNATVSADCSPSSQASNRSDSAVDASYVPKTSNSSRVTHQQQLLKVDALDGSDNSSHADASSSCTTARRESSRSSSARKEQREDLARPFKCDQCDNSFNQRIHLQKHLSKHTGVKPYKCQQCDYATVERSHLKVHIRIHTGEKPFKCTYCEYATAQNSTLKIHLKRHHGGFMLECSHCGKSFPERNQFNAHQREHGAAPPEDTESTTLSPSIDSGAVAAGGEHRSPLDSSKSPATSVAPKLQPGDVKPAAARSSLS